MCPTLERASAVAVLQSEGTVECVLASSVVWCVLELDVAGMSVVHNRNVKVVEGDVA